MSAQYLGYLAACKTICANRTLPALNYAVGYAQEGQGMAGQPARVQALYILGNMTTWRGDTAKQVREALKAYAKS